MKKLNQNGVTLLALVITIVVLLILASVATYSGIDIIRTSRLNTFTAEMKIMQTEVNNLYEQWKSGQIAIDENTGNITKQENGTTISIGKDLTYNSTVEDQATYVLIDELGLGSSLSDLKGYKYFDYETIENLGIEGTEGEFLVSIKDRKVVSYEGLRYDGIMYYTLEQLPQSLYNVEYNPTQGEPTFDLSCENIGSGQWKIKISNIQYDGYINKWQIRYRVKAAEGENENSWEITEEFTGDNYTIDIPINNLLDTYEIQVFNGENVISKPYDYQILKIGAYVDYTYDETENYIINSENSGTDSNPATGIPQTKELKWRILKVHNDGTIDLVSDTSTDTEIYFKGAVGYNNGVYILNDICAKQYSNSKLGITARSLNLEDIEEELNEQGIELRNEYSDTTQANIKYGGFKLYNGVYPMIYARENGSWTDITTDISNLTDEEIKNNLKKDGIGRSENGYTDVTTEKASEIENGLIITQTYYNLQITSEYLKNSDIYPVLFERDESYWLASRCTSSYVAYAQFGICGVNKNLIGGNGVFNSSKGEGNASRKIRPVVTLKADSIKLVINNEENNENNPYKIIKIKQ